MALVGATAPTPNTPATRAEDRDRVPLDIPRDQWKRPLIRQVDEHGNLTGKTIGYTRASTLGKALEDESNLTRWKLRVLMWAAGRRDDLVLGAAGVGGYEEKSDKDALDEFVTLGLDAGGAGDKARIGTALHALTERVDRGEPLPNVGGHQRALDAYAELMRRHFRVVLSEVFIVHDELRTAGTFDRVVETTVWMQPNDGRGRAVGPPLPPGTLLVLDLKTSGTADFFGIGFAVQTAVYQAGRVYDPETGSRTELPTNSDWALILHVPSGGCLAELHWVDLARGRELAELAVRVRSERSASRTLISRAAIEPWTDRIEDAGVREAVADLVVPAPVPLGPGLQQAAARRKLLDLLGRVRSESEAYDLFLTNRRIWTDEHTAAVAARLGELQGVAS